MRRPAVQGDAGAGARRSQQHVAGDQTAHEDTGEDDALADVRKDVVPDGQRSFGAVEHDEATGVGQDVPLDRCAAVEAQRRVRGHVGPDEVVGDGSGGSRYTHLPRPGVVVVDMSPHDAVVLDGVCGTALPEHRYG